MIEPEAVGGDLEDAVRDVGAGDAGERRVADEFADETAFAAAEIDDDRALCDWSTEMTVPALLVEAELAFDLFFDGSATSSENFRKADRLRGISPSRRR